MTRKCMGCGSTECYLVAVPQRFRVRTDVEATLRQIWAGEPAPAHKEYLRVTIRQRNKGRAPPLRVIDQLVVVGIAFGESATYGGVGVVAVDVRVALPRPRPADVLRREDHLPATLLAAAAA